MEDMNLYLRKNEMKNAHSNPKLPIPCEENVGIIIVH